MPIHTGTGAHAETNSADMLKWTPKEQAAYVDLAVQMVGFVASQNDGPQARCINDWYFKDDKVRERGIQQILSAMRQYPSELPGVMVLAVLQKACGSFKYKQR
jgi:hypothetical protein